MGDVHVQPSRPAAVPQQEVAGGDRDVMLGAARATLALHLPDDAGFCHGCLDLWARLAPACCPAAEWAMRVLQTYGVATPAPASTLAAGGNRPVNGGQTPAGGGADGPTGR